MIESIAFLRSRTAKKIMIMAGYVSAIIYAVYIRINFTPGVLGDPYVNIPDPDIARFYRLIDLIYHHYPSLPMLDSYANFPWGMKVQLPPVWAFLEASFALFMNRVIGISIQSAAALFPLIMGMLFVVPTYYAGKLLFGRAAGHMSVIVSLFFPIVVLNSAIGMVDHHIADIFLYMLIIALLLGARQFYIDGKDRYAGVVAVATGFAIAFTLLISLSSILLILILGTVFLGGFLFLPAQERPYNFKIGVITMGASGLFMLLLFFITPWFESRLTFSGLSLFQPMLLIGLTGIIATSFFIDKSLFHRGTIRVFALLGFYFYLAAVALVLPGIGQQIMRGFYRSIAYYPLGRITSQLRPLFAFGPKGIMVFLSKMAFFIPLGFIYVIRESLSNRYLDFGRFLFVVWFAIAGVYAVAVMYYTFLFAPVAIISLGLIIADPTRLIRVIIGTNKDKDHQDRKPIGIAWLFTIIALISLPGYWITISGLSRPNHEQNGMYWWIRGHTEKTSYYNDPFKPNRMPEYGILTDWSSGEIVGLVTERPVIATGNQETGLNGIIASHRILQSRSEHEALSLMKSYRLRYVLLGGETSRENKYGTWGGDIERIGESGSDPDKIARHLTKEQLPRRDFMQLLSVRLHYLLGAGDEKYHIEPLQHFRLIKTTGTKSKNIHTLFELVKGTRLIIKADPGTPITIATKIRPEKLRPITWKLTTKVGVNGEVEAYLPYATKNSRYPVKADQYSILAGNKTLSLDVMEHDISESKTIYLTALKK